MSFNLYYIIKSVIHEKSWEYQRGNQKPYIKEGQKKNGQTIIYKRLFRILRIEQHEPP